MNEICGMKVGKKICFRNVCNEGGSCSQSLREAVGLIILISHKYECNGEFVCLQ
jgi:hypothetical protein